MPDPESAGTEDELTEGQTGILDTIKNAVGLGGGEDAAPADEAAEPEATPRMSAKATARKNYHACAGKNHARKQALKNKRAG